MIRRQMLSGNILKTMNLRLIGVQHKYSQPGVTSKNYLSNLYNNHSKCLAISLLLRNLASKWKHIILSNISRKIEKKNTVYMTFSC